MESATPVVPSSRQRTVGSSFESRWRVVAVLAGLAAGCSQYRIVPSDGGNDSNAGGSGNGGAAGLGGSGAGGSGSGGTPGLGGSGAGGLGGGGNVGLGG